VLEMLVGLDYVADELLSNGFEIVDLEEQEENNEYAESLMDGSMDMMDDYNYEGDE
jgi:methanogenic corrinoid protein MtbC1